MTGITLNLSREMLGWPAMKGTKVRTAPTNKGMVLHWDGSARGLPTAAHSECIAYWKFVRRFHINSRGWLDIGYAWGICPHGGRFEGRGWGYEQAAQPGGNRDWESCTLMLGPGEMPTPAQIEGVRSLRADLMILGMGEEIRPHARFVGTDCPGPIIKRMIIDGTFSVEPRRENWTEKLVNSLPTLGLGDVSYDVKSVRWLLGARGYLKLPANADIIEFLNSTEFDIPLREIVEVFQSKNKLNVDGIVGPKTWAKLHRR